MHIERNSKFYNALFGSFKKNAKIKKVFEKTEKLLLKGGNG
jgi:hypothetical protein